jgi:hypothetical protein
MFRKVIFTVLLLTGASLSAQAADFDGSAPIYCALTKVLECQGSKGCEYVFPEEVFLPGFIRIDFQKSLVTAKRGEEVLTTGIKNVLHQDGNIILQGLEHRAWSLMIGEKTGRLTLAVAGEDDGFVIFGSCMVP